MGTINLGPCECCGSTIDPCAAVTCPSDNVCLAGICYPTSAYYCCYDQTPPADATLLEEFLKTATFGCQFGPCFDQSSSGDDPVYNARKIKAGPSPTNIECNAVCTKFNCLVSSNYKCQPDPNGEYPTIEQCRDACRDQTACQSDGGSDFTTVTFNSTNIAGNFVSVLSPLPYAAGVVRLEYNAFSIPDRFQLWGPTLDFNTKQVIASRVIKGDSQYRGREDGLASCPDDNNISIEGEGEGFIVWNKPEAACYVEVAVFAPCDGTGWEADLSFTGNSAP